MHIKDNLCIILGYGSEEKRGTEMKKDSSGVVVARVFITIVLTVTIGLLSIGVALKASFFNLKTWKDFFQSDDFIDIFMSDDDIDEMLDDPILEDDFDKDFFPEYYNFLIDEVFEALETGETELDEDRLDDIYDEYLEDIIHDNAPPAERNKFKDDFFDTSYEAVEDLYDSFEEAGLLEYMETFEKGFVIFAAVTGFISAGLIVLMILISKNKFAAVRNTGIALTICEVFNALIIGGLFALFMAGVKSAASDSSSDEAVVNAVSKFLTKCAGTSIGVIAAGLILGIFLIVFGVISSKNAARLTDEDDESSQYVLTEE